MGEVKWDYEFQGRASHRYKGVPFQAQSMYARPAPNKIFDQVHNLVAVAMYLAPDFDGLHKSFLGAVKSYKAGDRWGTKPYVSSFYNPAELEKGWRELLEGMEGLVFATTPTYPEYMKGAQSLLRLGFRLATKECYWNPNYDGRGVRGSHWLHLWVKEVTPVKRFGKFHGASHINAQSREGNMNCCGMYWFVDEDLASSEAVSPTYSKHSMKKPKVAFFQKEKPPKDFIPILEAEDGIMGLLPPPTKANIQTCPHTHTDEEITKLTGSKIWPIPPELEAL